MSAVSKLALKQGELLEKLEKKEILKNNWVLSSSKYRVWT